MKIKFNKFERAAAIFVLTALVGAVMMTLAVGFKKGWFASKVALYTVFDRADGLYPGTAVQISGLRAGEVDSVGLTTDNRIRVKFEIREPFFKRLKQDSIVQVKRPFLIGEKILDLSVGSDDSPPLKPNATVSSVETTDLVDLLSGNTLGSDLSLLSKAIDNLRVVAEAFTDPKRSRALVKAFDEMRPLMTNVSEASRQFVRLSKQVNEEDVVHISTNVARLSDEMTKLLPILQDIAPQLPHASHRAIEALDETVITLKALQRSFLIRGAAKQVREEEANEAKQPESRTPAESTH